MILLVLQALLLRISVGFYGYSGQGKPPMFGDYEAQRHWMEITYNLPINQWYHNTTHNDLLYWGLDYPPLTAYHSWICGAMSHLVNPSYVELETSRGYESSDHKFFMRNTVIIADILFFILPVLLLNKSITTRLHLNKVNLNMASYVLLTYPGIILIDHGHFQFNCVSLGFVLYSIWALDKNKDVLCTVLFCLAVNYKQMTFYYSLPFFMYFLNKCGAQFRSKGLSGVSSKFISLAVTVIFTFAVIWGPFACHENGIFQVARRLFPLDRGVFEDKVANFWCVLNVIYKVKNYFSNEKTAILCAVLTFLSVLPSCFHLLHNGNTKTFLYSLFNCSLGFFFFSFQVHEKTILFVALPALLLFDQEIFHCFWFLMISTFSMLPLFLKDGLIIPYFALNAIFSLSVFLLKETKKIDFLEGFRFSRWLRRLFYLSMIGTILLTLLTLTQEPPKKYPDLFPLLISAYSAGHFAYFLLYFYWSQFIC